MRKALYDTEYLSIVNNILENKEFNEIKNMIHHGISKYDHSLRVSYNSYKVAKSLKLNYIEVARAGLLHDFFESPAECDYKARFKLTFNHPKKVVKQAGELFELTEKEKDMIKSHMFPINLTLPKYAESWVVNVVDKAVGTYEFANKFKYKISYFVNIYLILLFNSIK